MNIGSRAIPDMFVGHSRYVHRPMNIGSLSGFIFSPQHTNKFVCVQLIENVHFYSCLFTTLPGLMYTCTGSLISKVWWGASLSIMAGRMSPTNSESSESISLRVEIRCQYILINSSAACLLNLSLTYTTISDTVKATSSSMPSMVSK